MADETHDRPVIDEKNPLFAEEMRRRVIYSLFLPAVRLAYVFGIPVKELTDWLQMAYYHETRRRGLKMREAVEVLKVSMRKVALLSKRLKVNFMLPEAEVGLPRRIEFMLWAGPLSRARICQVMPEEEPDAIASALERLLEQRRVERVEGRVEQYQVIGSSFRLVHDNWLSRIDALNNLVASVSNAVYARFFRHDDRAFARTVSLRVRKEELVELEKLYRDTIWKTLVALDESAEGDVDAETMDISILWAPYEYIKRHPEGDES